MKGSSSVPIFRLSRLHDYEAWRPTVNTVDPDFFSDSQEDGIVHRRAVRAFRVVRAIAVIAIFTVP